MYKTRTLSTDKGDTPGLTWTSSSSGTLPKPGSTPTAAQQVILDMLTEDGIKKWYLYGKSKATVTVSMPVWQGSEMIQGTTKPKPHFNAVEHQKSVCFNYARAALVGSQTGTMYHVRYRRFAVPNGITIPGERNPVSWSAFDGAQRRAWWSMQPRFESEIQMLNFIYELKDFKRLAKFLVNFKIMEMGKTLKRMRRKLRAYWAETRQQSVAQNAGITLAEITRAAAEARLVESFAIRPLINDLSAIFTTLAQTVESAQQQFADRGNLHQLSHYSEIGEDTRTLTSGSNNSCMIKTGSQQASLFTATMQYSYRYKMRKGWDLFMRGYGLEFDAEVLWNALPFTFLVDYVYQIGRAIHFMKSDPNVFLKLHQYCESILMLDTNGIFFDTTDSKSLNLYVPCSKSAIGSLVPLCGYKRERYRRRVCSPNKGVALPRIKGPSKGQIWNVVALVRCLFL